MFHIHHGPFHDYCSTYSVLNTSEIIECLTIAFSHYVYLQICIPPFHAQWYNNTSCISVFYFIPLSRNYQSLSCRRSPRNGMSSNAAVYFTSNAFPHSFGLRLAAFLGVLQRCLLKASCHEPWLTTTMKSDNSSAFPQLIFQNLH